MPEPRKKSSAMLPLIIIGATLFAFGTYQSLRPEVREVNSGFVAPAANPRTMQAPDAPAMEKDAAQRAAEADTITASITTTTPQASTKSIVDEAWFRELTTENNEAFRGRVLNVLALQQLGKSINCTPSLAGMSDGNKAALEEIACTATDGSRIEGRFNGENDGRLEVTAPDNKRVTIRKDEDSFYVQTELSER